MGVKNDTGSNNDLDFKNGTGVKKCMKVKGGVMPKNDLMWSNCF